MPRAKNPLAQPSEFRPPSGAGVEPIQHEGLLSLVCSDRKISKVFEVTGLDRVFRIYPSRVEAVEQLDVSSRPPA